MKTLSWEAFLGLDRKENPKVAMTIGVFDGVHAGHAALIEKIVSRRDCEPWVITFRENPKKVLRPGEYPGDLLPLEEKLEKLKALGIQRSIIIDFSREFGKMGGADFISRVYGSCSLSFLALGQDFHFGRGADTGAEKVRLFLEPLGVCVEVIPPVKHGDGKVSSTRIRGFIRQGDFAEAAAMLGHSYRLTLKGWHKEGQGASSVQPRLLPRDGTYAALLEGSAGEKETWLRVEGGRVFWHYNGDVKAITFV